MDSGREECQSTATAHVEAVPRVSRSGGRDRHAKDSDRYKVANCTQPQPVFYCFPRLARGKVIAVTVLRAFREPDTIPNRYQLIEIPSGLFKSLENAPESKIGRPDGEGSSGREEPPSAAAWRAQD